MSEIVLPTFARNRSVIDGVNGAMMIAAETTGAATIMFPLGKAVEGNIADRAFLGTPSTMDAHIAVHSKLLVRYHKAVEVSTYDVAESPGSQS